MTDVVDFDTEKRIRAANAAADATLWTPRDVLVDALRAIDAGEANPTTLAVVWLEPTESGKGMADKFRISVEGDRLESNYKATFLAEAFKRSVWDNGTA